MNFISEEKARKMASLAKLTLAENEVHQFAAQLEAILDYVSILNSVDTSGVEPLWNPLIETESKDRLREDESRKCPESILSTTSNVQDDQFLVPPVISGNK